MQTHLHPLHAILLAGALTLFLAVLLADVAYATSYELQWKNFASWLLVGGLIVAGVVLLWTLIDLSRAGRRASIVTRFVLVFALCVLGLIDAFAHAEDAWASMPKAAVLSTIVALLALAATWLGFFGSRTGAAR